MSRLRVGAKSKGRPLEAALSASVPIGERPFGGLSCQLPERLGEMLSVMQEEDAPCAALHEKRHQRSVGLRSVAVLAGQNQVVGTVVSRLTSSGPHVIERDRVFRCFRSAIRANGAVLCKEPIAVRLH